MKKVDSKLSRREVVRIETENKVRTVRFAKR